MGGSITGTLCEQRPPSFDQFDHWAIHPEFPLCKQRLSLAQAPAALQTQAGMLSFWSATSITRRSRQHQADNLSLKWKWLLARALQSLMRSR
jgi:hypothetical protein